MIEKIILKKSAVLDKMPTTEQLEYGEIALNYNAEHPFLSFKDSDGDVMPLNDYSQDIAYLYSHKLDAGVLDTINENSDAIKKKLNITDFNTFKADNTKTINALDRNVSQNSSEIQEVNGIVQNHTTAIAQKADKTELDTINANVDQKVGKTDIVQSTGTSTTSVMSQKAVSDALSNVYTKSESDAMIATKQNVLTAGEGVTIADDVISVDAISVDDKKFTVWSNPRIDEYVTTFTNFGYNDNGTQKTSGSSTRSWVFRIGNYGHKKVYFNEMNAWMCDGLDDSQNMVNPTLLGKNNGTVDITEEHIGKYIVAMSVGDYPNLLGTELCRCIQFCDEKTQAELDADEKMLSDMYAGNLMRYAVATSEIGDTPTLEWGKVAYLSSSNLHNILLDIVSRPNIAYECNVVKRLNFLYQGCGRLIEITPLWDTSLVTAMRSIFNNCIALERADLTHLNLSSVTNVSFMFYRCIVLKEIKMPSLPSVTTCLQMFQNCTSLQSVTLPELPSLTNCISMFNNCSSLKSITLPELPSVTNCQIMFYNCTSLQSITLPHLPSATNCGSMFMLCSSLQSLRIDFPNCKDLSQFFYNCRALHTVEIVDIRNATNLENAFYLCSSLQNVTCVEELPKCAISFSSSSKLTLESVTNIITHLPDLSGENSKTLTLHATTKSLLTESLIAEATNKNWIIA